MNITDHRRSSAGFVLGTATDSTSWGGVAISSNGLPAPGTVPVATGSNSAIWRDALSFGSNTNDVSNVGTMGASSSNTRADHVHRGVGAITAAGSNPVYGTVNLQAGTGAAITTSAAGTVLIAAPNILSIAHASNTFRGVDLTFTTPGNSVAITMPTTNTLAFSSVGGSGGGGGGSGGEELDYAQITTGTINITATTEATANTIVTGASVSFNGQPVLLEFFCPDAAPDGTVVGRAMTIWLYEDGTSIGSIVVMVGPAANAMRIPITGSRRFTPSSGSHTYSIRGSVSAGTGFIRSGAGGNGNQAPSYMRITRV